MTTTSDVYQLGVLLYRLLSGRLPHELEDRDLADFAREVATTTPHPPSALLPGGDAAEEASSPDSQYLRHERSRVEGELDSITLRALSIEPDDRYPSVEGLLEDVGRFLRKEPVSAMPDSQAYRARTFLRRNPVSTTAAALVALVLVGYVTTLVAYSHRLEEERAAAHLEAEKARQVTEFVTGLFQQANPDVSRGETVSARELLAEGTARLRSGLQDQPGLRATLLFTTAGVYRSLGLTLTAGELASEALATRRRILPPDDPEILASLVQLGSIVQRTDADSARALFQEALTLAEDIHGPDHPRVAEVLKLLAAYGGLDEPLKTETFQRSIGILLGAGDRTTVRLAETLELSTHGTDLPLDEKIARLEEAVRIFRARLGPDNARVGETLNDMALALEESDPLAADTLMRKAIQVHRAAGGATNPTTLTLMNNYAGVLRDRGEWRSAEAAYREVLQLRRAAHPDDAVNLAYTLYGLGYTLNRLDRSAEAVPLLREAMDAFQEGDTRRQLIQAELADALRAQGREPGP